MTPATTSKRCACGRVSSAVIGGYVAHVERRTVEFDPEDRVRPVDCYQAHVVDVGYPSGREECETICLPLTCPVGVGDRVWRSGMVALWSPMPGRFDTAYDDLPFVRADRMRGPYLLGERQRMEVMAALERGWKGWLDGQTEGSA